MERPCRILGNLGGEAWRGGIKKEEQKPALRDRIVLTDGGVYDNLGLESVFPLYHRLIVSDGGGQTDHELEPDEDWARHAVRTMLLLDQQVRNLRKRILVGAFVAKEKVGLYFSMRTELARLEAERAWPVDQRDALALAETPTRLQALAPGSRSSW